MSFPDSTGARMGAMDLFEGGPTHRLMLRLRLLKSRAPQIVRGAALLSLFAWLPLLSLSAYEGHLVGKVQIPFLLDFGVHARLLLSLPLMILVEIVVGPRLGTAAALLIGRGLVRPEQHGRFERAVDEALRTRDSATLEVALLALAYAGAFMSLGISLSFAASSWDLLIGPSGPRLTLAGIWSTFVSVPLYQFLLYRTMARLIIWSRFLLAMARLDLQIVPTHPDRAGGLGFLGGAHRPIGLLAVAVGTVLAGRYCSEILYGGATLATLRAPIASFVAVMLVLCLGPLVVFMPGLIAARRRGLVEYGGLALRYVTEFDRKWLRGGAPAGEELLGSGDIQSLADLGSAFERIEQMRPVPFGLKDVSSLAAACLVPMLPVFATAMPIEEILKTAIKIIG
jgi:hypothetical protein